MDLGIQPITGIVASSTTSYLFQFKSIFLLIGGIVLAFVVLQMLIDILRPQREMIQSNDAHVDY